LYLLYKFFSLTKKKRFTTPDTESNIVLIECSKHLFKSIYFNFYSIVNGFNRSNKSSLIFFVNLIFDRVANIYITVLPY
jgi:hypothetical protein